MNKKYRVEFSKQAINNLKKMDRYTKIMIFNWIQKNLENCENPFFSGKPLKGKYENLWRYRVGDYRIISEIQNETLIIFLIKIGHRREIYKK